jgi:hypothetical protein
MKWGRIIWTVVGLLVLIGLAGLLAPELDAGRMRQPLATALEQTLGRPVAVREVKYQVFPTPGLSATDLVIPDDPAFGLEPLAYVGEIQAGISWTSLFTGNLRISSVRLVEASVNLARKEELGWNFSRLLERIAQGVKQSGGGPRVEMREGRINFRGGTLKSPFFLNAVDLDLEAPETRGGAWQWRYEASPARTDRAEQGFGTFSGRGRWSPSDSSSGHLQGDIELDRSVVSELLTLITGRDLGLQGRLSSRATMDGPLNALRIRGFVELEDVDRSTFFGLRGKRWALNYEGSLDLAGEKLEISTAKPKEKAPLPLSIQVACTRLLAYPSWEASFSFDEIPAPAMLELARKLGARAPEALKVEGLLVGSLHYSQSKPLEGSVELRGGQVSLGDAGPLKLETAQVSLAGSEVSLAPVAVSSSGGSNSQISGKWQMENESLEFEVESAGMPLNELKAAVSSLQDVAAVPLLESCQDGSLKGALRFERGPAGSETRPAWVGDVRVKDTVCAMEGTAGSWNLAQAAVSMQRGQWRIREAAGQWGNWKFTGSATHNAAARRPVKFTLALEAADGARVDEFFRSGLLVRRGILDRTLRRAPVLPQWLRGRHAEGDVEIDTLKLGDRTLTDFAARLYWDGARVEMPDVTAQWEEGRLSGRLSVKLGGEALEYHAKGRVDGLEWRRGQVDARFDVQTPTLAGPFAKVLRGSGELFGRNLEVGEETLRQVDACLDYDGERAPQRLKVTCLSAATAAESFIGQGAAGPDGRLSLELTSPRRTLRLAGTLIPLTLEFASGEAGRTR